MRLFPALYGCLRCDFDATTAVALRKHREQGCSQSVKAHLECDTCHAVIRTADDLGFGYRGSPRVGVTHACDRFQYGKLIEVKDG